MIIYNTKNYHIESENEKQEKGKTYNRNLECLVFTRRSLFDPLTVRNRVDVVLCNVDFKLKNNGLTRNQLETLSHT